jgi:hypothetical protein
MTSFSLYFFSRKTKSANRQITGVACKAKSTERGRRINAGIALEDDSPSLRGADCKIKAGARTSNVQYIEDTTKATLSYDK